MDSQLRVAQDTGSNSHWKLIPMPIGAHGSLLLSGHVLLLFSNLLLPPVNLMLGIHSVPSELETAMLEFQRWCSLSALGLQCLDMRGRFFSKEVRT